MSKFKEKTRLYKVYHIRMKGNEDIMQGYVGITRRSLPYRLSQHFQSTRPVGHTLRELGRDAVEIVQLAMLNKTDALNMEYTLRPDLHIGWNCRAGGDMATVRCTVCGKALPKRATGTKCGDCANSKFTKGQVPHNYGQGEKYRLTSPEGVVYEPEAFTIFCKENDLTPQNLRKVAKGHRQHHKGWTAEKIA